MKIAFFDGETVNEQRKGFHEALVQLGFPRFSAWEMLGENIPDILFYHPHDIGHLRPTTGDGEQEWRPELLKVWLIAFGGERTAREDMSFLGEKVIGYIHYADVRDRLSDIRSKVNASSEITKEKLETIVFAIDPDLENLLEGICTKLPFTDSWNSSLQKQRNELIKLLNKKHDLDLK